MAAIVRLADCPPVPWKNGAGTTRELWARRDGGGEALIRISIAEIRGEQAFSTFPGTDRVILQLDGPPMVLTVDGIDRPLDRLTPLAFPGEARVACRADAGTVSQDLNLMCRRDLYAPHMERLETGAATTLHLGRTGCVTALLALAPVVIGLPRDGVLAAKDMLVAEGPFQLRTVRPAAFIAMTATGPAPP